MRQVAVWCREELHRVNPDLLLCVYVLEIGNWFCRGLAEGLSTPDLPVINFCEHTYYGVGYDRPWLDKTMGRFKDLGRISSRAAPCGTCTSRPRSPDTWRPTPTTWPCGPKAGGTGRATGCMTTGGASWPMTANRPARPTRGTRRSWRHAEIDRTMQQPGRTSSLDTAEKVAWKGKYRESEGGWAADSGVAPRKEPQVRLHLAQPARLYFVLP